MHISFLCAQREKEEKERRNSRTHKYKCTTKERSERGEWQREQTRDLHLKCTFRNVWHKAKWYCLSPKTTRWPTSSGIARTRAWSGSRVILIQISYRLIMQMEFKWYCRWVEIRNKVWENTNWFCVMSLFGVGWFFWWPLIRKLISSGVPHCVLRCQTLSSS